MDAGRATSVLHLDRYQTNNTMPTIPPSKRRPWQPEPKKPFVNSRRDIYNTSRWGKMVARRKAEHPICMQCHAAPTACTDHITPLSQGGAPYDEANLQELCHTCHQRKTREEAEAAKWARKG
jgi:5-methylcytosine-specific restriction endonuclease McrA